MEIVLIVPVIVTELFVIIVAAMDNVHVTVMVIAATVVATVME